MFNLFEVSEAEELYQNFANNNFEIIILQSV